MQLPLPLPPIHERDLQRIVDEIRADTGAPAIGVAVSIAGKRLFAAAGSAALDRGHALTQQSRFETSCLMKFITSLVALNLSARGALDLEASIAGTLPELDPARAQPISIKHLMSHSSGYRGVDISEGAVRWGFSWEKLVAHLRQHEPSFAPGVVFNYEHTEHVLLAEIIRRHSGRSVSEWAREFFFDAGRIELRPASPGTQAGEEFVAHHVYSDKHGRFVAAALPPYSAFWESSLPNSTLRLEDMLALGELLQRAARDDSAHAGIGPAVTQNLLRYQIPLRPQVPSGPRSEKIPSVFGVVAASYGAGVLGHNASSSGQTTALRFDLERNFVIAAGVNAYLPYARDAVVSRILAHLSTESAAPPATARSGDMRFDWHQLAGDFPAAQIAGRYIGSYFGLIDVSEAGAGLRLDLGPERRPVRPRVQISRVENGAFAMDSPVPTQLAFFPDTNGEPVLAMGVHTYKKLLP